jgi:mannose-binding lectin 2
MIGNGNNTYNHLEDGSESMVGGCSVNFVNREHPVHAKVIYAANTLEVLIELDSETGWTTCFKKPDVQLPASGYLGFSAKTGAAHCKK